MDTGQLDHHLFGCWNYRKEGVSSLIYAIYLHGQRTNNNGSQSKHHQAREVKRNEANNKIPSKYKSFKDLRSLKKKKKSKRENQGINRNTQKTLEIPENKTASYL